MERLLHYSVYDSISLRRNDFAWIIQIGNCGRQARIAVKLLICLRNYRSYIQLPKEILLGTISIVCIAKASGKTDEFIWIMILTLHRKVFGGIVVPREELWTSPYYRKRSGPFRMLHFFKLGDIFA